MNVLIEMMASEVEYYNFDKFIVVELLLFLKEN